jgi:ammonium transporter, Amt family
MHYIPGLRLRASEEAEILGIDDAEMGEFAYDYVGLDQEIGHSVSAHALQTSSRESNEKRHAH